MTVSKKCHNIPFRHYVVCIRNRSLNVWLWYLSKARKQAASSSPSLMSMSSCAEIIRVRIPSHYLFATDNFGIIPHLSHGHQHFHHYRCRVRLFGSEFLGHVVSVTNQGNILVVAIHDVGGSSMRSSYASATLQYVLSKSVCVPLNALSPPLALEA